MKKRFILLPLLLFVLAGCDPIVDPTDTGTSPTTTDPTTTDPTTTDPTTTDPTTTDPDDETVDVPSVNLLAEYDKDDEVDFADVEVIVNSAANAVLTAVTPDGIVFVNYFGSPQYVKDDLADVVAGDHLAIEGTVDIATGGDYARARTVKPSDVTVLIESDWAFGKLIAETPEIDMLDGFGAWADVLSVDSYARTYRFTNVVFKQTYGGSDPAGTGFHLFTYDSSVAGKNTGVGGYYRIGFYKVDLSGVTIEDDGIYTVEGILGGTNKDMPFAAGANPSIRVTYLASITKTGTVPSDPDPDDPDPDPSEPALSVTINNAIPEGWTYISNDPVGFPNPGYYGNGGLKLNFVDMGIQSPVFTATYHKVTIGGVLNANTKADGDPTAISLVVGGAVVDTWVASVTPYSGVELNSVAGFTQFSLILTSLKGYNVNLQTIAVS